MIDVERLGAEAREVIFVVAGKTPGNAPFGAFSRGQIGHEVATRRGRERDVREDLAAVRGEIEGAFAGVDEVRRRAPRATIGAARSEGSDLHFVRGGDVTHGKADEGRGVVGDRAGREPVEEDAAIFRGDDEAIGVDELGREAAVDREFHRRWAGRGGLFRAAAGEGERGERREREGRAEARKARDHEGTLRARTAREKREEHAAPRAARVLLGGDAGRRAAPAVEDG